VTSKRRVSDIMSAMSEGRVRPLFDAMAEDVTWRWMGVKQWTRSFNGKQTVVDTLFGGNAETLSPSSSVEVHCIHADGDFVIAEHSGRNKLPDGRRYPTSHRNLRRRGRARCVPDRPVNAGNSRSLSDSVIRQLTWVLAG